MFCIGTLVAAFFFPFAWYYSVVPKEDGSVRFLAPLVPLICLYAAVGIAAVLTAVDDRLAVYSSRISLREWLPASLTVSMMCVVLYVLVTQDTHLPGSLPPIPEDHAEVHQWLVQNMTDDDVIMVSGMTPYWRYLWLAKFHGRWAFWYQNAREVTEDGVVALTRLLGSKRARNRRYILLHRDDVLWTAALQRFVVWNERDGFETVKPIEGWTRVYQHSNRPSSFVIYQVEEGAPRPAS
jgi:hypothetical protein